MPKSILKPIHYRPFAHRDIRFSKLFMSHLDAEFHKQKSPDLKHLVPHQVSFPMLFRISLITQRCSFKASRFMGHSAMGVEVVLNEQLTFLSLSYI